MRLVKNSFLLMMAVPAIAGLAIIATAGTAQADIAWAAGAPGGTSGGSASFAGPEGDPSANGTGFLATGLQNGYVNGDYTVSMWLRTSDVSAQQFAVGTTSQSLHLGLQNGAPLQGHWSNDAAGETSVAIANDTWFHATFTYDADGGLFTPNGGSETVTGLHSIFINGVEIESTTVNADGRADGPNFDNAIILGARQNGGDVREQWLGEIDDVAFFDSVLLDSDIATLDNSDADPLGLGANAYYDFEDDQTGTTAAVQVAAGENAFGASTLTGITAIAVPEPSSFALLACIGAAGLVRRKRR